MAFIERNRHARVSSSTWARTNLKVFDVACRAAYNILRRARISSGRQSLLHSSRPCTWSLLVHGHLLMLPAKYRPSLHATYTLLHLIVATTVRWDPEFVPELACSYGECAMPCTELTRAVLQQLGLPAIVTLIWIRTSPQRMRRLYFRGGTIRIGSYWSFPFNVSLTPRC